MPSRHTNNCHRLATEDWPYKDKYFLSATGMKPSSHGVVDQHTADYTTPIPYEFIFMSFNTFPFRAMQN